MSIIAFDAPSTGTVSSSVDALSVTNNGSGAGLFGSSADGEGIHGETNSANVAAVIGLALNASNGVAAVVAKNSGHGVGVFASSESGEGVHGETNSADVAAVTGIALNQSNGVAAVFGKNNGHGVGVFGSSESGEGVHGETNSTSVAAVTGLALNAGNGVAAVVGKNNGSGVGVFGSSVGGEGVHGETDSASVAAVTGIALSRSNGVAAVFGKNNGHGAGVFGSSVAGEGVHGETNSATVAAVAGINNTTTGIGVFGGGGRVAGSFDGNVEISGNLTMTGPNSDIILSGGDCAEDFDIGGLDSVEPGMVMVIDTEGSLRPCQEAYDRKVTGVISGAGDLRPGIVLDKQGGRNNRRPIALLGKVYCKVDARYGKIEVGDLLTTSVTAGHAMKADEPSKAFGAVVGKALRSFQAGQGLIPILIALQ